MELRYRAPLWVYGFYLFWYLLLTVGVVGLIGGGWAPEVTRGEKAMVMGIFAALLVAPLALHAFGTRRSAEELAELLDFLSEQAQAKR